MLSLSRREGEMLILDIPPNCPPGPIALVVREFRGRCQVRLSIKAPIQVGVSRYECLNPEDQARIRRLVDGGQKPQHIPF